MSEKLELNREVDEYFEKCREETPHYHCEGCHDHVYGYCSFACHECGKVICLDCLLPVLGEKYEVIGMKCPFCGNCTIQEEL
jgi:hypothetical protein